nr:hypothetical protein [Tanacetum cinerariifolium]
MEVEGYEAFEPKSYTVEETRLWNSLSPILGRRIIDMELLSASGQSIFIFRKWHNPPGIIVYVSYLLLCIMALLD